MSGDRRVVRGDRVHGRASIDVAAVDGVVRVEIMVRDGSGESAVGPVAPRSATMETADSAKLRAEIDALDAAEVPNGHKAISIWLHSNWNGELADRWGPHSNPHSIRYWRSVSRRLRAAGIRTGQ